MFELLQEILNSLDFFTDGNSSVNTDAIPHVIEFKQEVLGTSPSGNDTGASGSKPPKGDSEICKRLTDQVIEMQKNSTLNPVSTIEQVDDEGRKHIAVAGGVKLPFVGDKTVSGCVSFPAPSPAPSKK